MSTLENEKDTSHVLKTQLLQVLIQLAPKCHDSAWLAEQIAILEKRDLPESRFEMSGILRAICYELIQKQNELFTQGNPITADLNNLINEYFNHIEVLEPPQDKMSFLALFYDLIRMQLEVFIPKSPLAAELNNLLSAYIALLKKPQEMSEEKLAKASHSSQKKPSSR